jgi:molybdopterin converting factor small subunit
VISVTVRLFAALREAAGAGEITLADGPVEASADSAVATTDGTVDGSVDGSRNGDEPDEE